MANIHNISKWYDVQLHTATDCDTFFDEYLPKGYPDLVRDRIVNDSSSAVLKDRHIYDVRIGRVKNLTVFSALLDIANQNKKTLKKIKVTAKKSLESIND